MKNNSQRSFSQALVFTTVLVISSVSHGAITPISEDFESYTTTTASGFAPWQFYSDNGGLGDYGTVLSDGPPPTDPTAGGIQALTEFQGNKFLNFYANYNNTAVHDNPALREDIRFYREFDFKAADTATGTTWVFDFLYFSNANFPITGDTQTGAYIRVFDPVFNILYENSLDTTLAPADSVTFGQLLVALDPNWADGKLQVGFYNITGNNNGSGMFYDNVNFSVVPVPAAIWLFGSGLIGLIGLARRKKSQLDTLQPNTAPSGAVLTCAECPLLAELRSTLTNHMSMPGVRRMSVVAPNSEVHETLI